VLLDLAFTFHVGTDVGHLLEVLGNLGGVTLERLLGTFRSSLLVGCSGAVCDVGLSCLLALGFLGRLAELTLFSHRLSLEMHRTRDVTVIDWLDYPGCTSPNKRFLPVRAMVIGRSGRGNRDVASPNNRKRSKKSRTKNDNTGYGAEGNAETEKGRDAGSGHRPSWLPSPKLLIGLLVLVVVGYFLFRAHSTLSELKTVVRHFTARRLPWLGISLAAEALSFWCYALVQRSLLIQGGARLSRQTMIELAVAATGLTNLLPGGTAPASGWLVSQYRKRGIPMPLALWAVLAGGLAATLSVLLLALAGAAVAGLVNVLEALLCLLALVAGAVGVVAGVRNVDRVEKWCKSHHLGRFDRPLTALSKRVADTARIRASPRTSSKVLVLSIGNWGLDVVCLIAAFPFLGLAVPWRAVLFAYAIAQIAGSVAPVPGGIGFVEGGMIGAFALTGTPVGTALLATIVYRLITSVGLAAAGSAMLLYLSRKTAPENAELSGAARRLD
jgi:putative heme transporter